LSDEASFGAPFHFAGTFLSGLGGTVLYYVGRAGVHRRW